MTSLLLQRNKVLKQTVASHASKRNEHFRAECGDTLPSFDLIKQWLQTYKRLSIPVTSIDHDSIRNLRSALPDRVIRIPYELNEFYITPPITTQDIRE